jgi:hypothetical protein
MVTESQDAEAVHDKLQKETERKFHNKRYGAEHDIRKALSCYSAYIPIEAACPRDRNSTTT